MLKSIGMVPARDLYIKFLHEMEHQWRSTAAS